MKPTPGHERSSNLPLDPEVKKVLKRPEPEGLVLDRDSAPSPSRRTPYAHANAYIRE